MDRTASSEIHRGKSDGPFVLIHPIPISDDEDCEHKNRSKPQSGNTPSSDAQSTLPIDSEFSPISSIPASQSSKKERYLTVEEFNYTMSLMDSKINALYKLCRYISDSQQESSRTLKKLAVEDELSANFWNVSI